MRSTLSFSFGKVGVEEVSLKEPYESAKSTGMSILGSLKRELGSLDLVTAWLHVRGMVNVIPGFTQTTNVINGFSDLILKLYGREVGMHARSAVGVQSLALDVISWVAKQHREIEVDRDVIRLTRFGFDNCEKYDPTFQRDIEY
jgi:hypothetical protein